MRIYTADELPQHLPDGTPNPDWMALRSSRFTGSEFYLFMSLAKKNELSETAESKLYEKALASLGYETDAGITTAAMERGTELESVARELYKAETFNDVREVGFVDYESLRAGCSPDGIMYYETPIVDDIYYQKDENGETKVLYGKPKHYIMRDLDKIDKIIEIKCPAVKNYIRMATGKIPTQYVIQCQYNMLITGAKSCDFVVYHPDMALSVQEIKPDEQIQADIKVVLEKLNARYDEILAQIQQYRKKD
jgi:hypothetical protein